MSLRLASRGRFDGALAGGLGPLLSGRAGRRIGWFGSGAGTPGKVAGFDSAEPVGAMAGFDPPTAPAGVFRPSRGRRRVHVQCVAVTSLAQITKESTLQSPR